MGHTALATYQSSYSSTPQRLRSTEVWRNRRDVRRVLQAWHRTARIEGRLSRLRWVEPADIDSWPPSVGEPFHAYRAVLLPDELILAQRHTFQCPDAKEMLAV